MRKLTIIAIAMLLVFAGSVAAQDHMTVTSATVTSLPDTAAFDAEYSFSGTVDGMAVDTASYSVHITIWDKDGFEILDATFVFVNVSKWSITIAGIPGGAAATICIVEFEDCVENFLIIPKVPSMTNYGLALLVLLLIGSTVWVLRRKRANVTA